MTDAQLLELIARYRLAYGAVDEKTLAAVVSDDFEWHMHYSDTGEIKASGKILFGVEAMVQEVRRRQASWRNLKYENLVERAAGDFILQMFTASGIDEKDRPFHVNVVDVYCVSQGLITKKDTYWKGTWGRFHKDN